MRLKYRVPSVDKNSKKNIVQSIYTSYNGQDLLEGEYGICNIKRKYLFSKHFYMKPKRTFNLIEKQFGKQFYVLFCALSILGKYVKKLQ